ncbi:iron-regulated protein A precursor [Vibrio sp. JCM 19236]|nr:iron-regulated protein A precursor [Vibrio sp. JCM 19236]
MQTWMYLQGGNINVPQADALSWKVQFWPDKKDTTGRQLKSVLRTNPNIDLADLKSQSATLQGLTALEWLLYEPQLDQDRCSLATTVSASLVDTSASYKQSLITNPWKG